MPLPVNDQSMAAVCRLCEHLAEARDAGRDTCGQDCGGPMKGKTFPRYKGPLTPGYIASHCFICGDLTPITVGLHGKMIGVCERHLIFLEKYLGELQKAPLEDRGIVKTTKVAVPIEEMLGLKKKE